MRRVSIQSAAVLVATLLLLAASCHAMDLVLVQLVHRHGARSAIVPANASVICPRGCGLLNLDGKEMLMKQGDYLRARYNGSRPEITPEIFFGSELYPDGTTYDVRHVYSRSTDLSRTLQSGAALLKGLFPNSTEYFPAIHTVLFEQDQLLLIDVVPSYHIYQALDMALFTSRLLEVVDNLFPAGVVEAISLELELHGFCFASPANLVPCVLGLQDTAATRNAEGRLSETENPTTFAYYSQLNDCRRTWNSYFYPFNRTNPVDVARGSLGQNLAQRMLQNMRAAMLPANASGALGRKLMHYSAHDTTVMPFVATLGQDSLMLPLFGELYLLDLLRDPVDNTYHVRAAQSVPGQTPSSQHAVNESVFVLSCMAPDNTTYTVASIDGTCPFADFERFVNATLPQDPAGLCYLSAAALAQIACDVVGGPGPLPNSTCYFYRTYCPNVACPAGSILSPLDASCVPLVVNTESSGTSAGVTAAATVGSAAVAFFGGLFIAKLLFQRTAAKYTSISDAS